MGILTEAQYRTYDLFNTSGVEKRIKEYKDLIVFMDEKIPIVELALEEAVYITKDLERMAYFAEDHSSGPIVEKFQTVSGEKKSDFNTIITNMEDGLEKLKSKRNEASTRLEFYKKKEKEEDKKCKFLEAKDYAYKK